ncbi:MAG: hypothetical protein ACT4ON_16070 [Bacteroidota bacterium]
MNILYVLGYKQRFEKVIKIIEHYKPKSVLELCFGDVFIAEYCKVNGIEWTGIDLNKSFVDNAVRKGLNARSADLLNLSELPKAEVCVIMGSLYHFYTDVHMLLSKMLEASDKIIISEPVKNLSDQKNLLGRIAKRSANAGKGDETFRYTEKTLQKLLEEESKKLNFSFKAIDSYKKDSIITIEKNGTN